jgi:uncharacterized cupredoxin-like copper-binding protein
MNARRFFGGAGIVAALALTACGGAGGEGAEGNGGGAQAVSVSADPSGTLAFQQTTLSGPANSEIPVTFSNPAPVQHNWVLVQPGQEDAVAAAGAANNGAVPDGTAGVIVAGSVLDANGEETITVPATPAGQYTYICTVPGHYQAGMRGTMTLQ